MQSEDRLAKLAEKLKEEREELTKEPEPSVAPIKIKGGGNINLGGTQVNINSAPPPDLLSPEQRRRLNRLVTEISSEYEADPRMLWKEVVHTRTGVSSIEDIPRDRFAEAEQALLDYREQLHAQAHAKRLADELDALARRSGVDTELGRFCVREYGTDQLNKLKPEQLKQALRFVEALGLEPRPVSQKPQAAKPAGYWQKLKDVAVDSPAQLLTLLLAGFVIGKIF